MLATYRRLLRNPALSRLLAGEFVSGIGDWLYLVALLIIHLLLPRIQRVEV